MCYKSVEMSLNVTFAELHVWIKGKNVERCYVGAAVVKCSDDRRTFTQAVSDSRGQRTGKNI